MGTREIMNANRAAVLSYQAVVITDGRRDGRTLPGIYKKHVSALEAQGMNRNRAVNVAAGFRRLFPKSKK